MAAAAFSPGLSSGTLRFPPNFVRQRSIKARRNCSNIGVAQIVAASRANNSGSGIPVVPAAKAVDTSIPVEARDDMVVPGNGGLQVESLPDLKEASFLSSDRSLTIHDGEVNALAAKAIDTTIPVEARDDVVVPGNGGLQVESLPDLKEASYLNSDRSLTIHDGEVNASADFFKKTIDLIDFKEKRVTSFEYGCYGNPTTAVAEGKISALEGAESTVIMASGICATITMIMALVPAGGHMVTTKDCYRKARIFIETILREKGITVTVIDPADIGALEDALNKNKVSLFFAESPTNLFHRCVDIERVSKLCHSKGALVCIDGTSATPLNQKALALGADLILHSAGKHIGGHNNVLAGCISGPLKLVSEIRILLHIMGGALNPNVASSIIQGMKTLHLRVQQQNSTGLRTAKILEAHPKVAHVYYPGLPSHPEHELAKKQMTGFGGVVSFEIDGNLDTTIKFVNALKIPHIAPSFGGCESIVDQPAIMSYWDLSQADRLKYGINNNLVRFSFGIEDFKVLKADILQALDTI